MYRLGSKFYRIQFAYNQIHSQHLVLVASCRTRTNAGQRTQGFTRSFFDKSVRICHCVSLKMPNNHKISSHRVNQILCVLSPFIKKLLTLRWVSLRNVEFLFQFCMLSNFACYQIDFGKTIWNGTSGKSPLKC